jgi:hypothetical protein
LAIIDGDGKVTVVSTAHHAEMVEEKRKGINEPECMITSTEGWTGGHCCHPGCKGHFKIKEKLI